MAWTPEEDNAIKVGYEKYGSKQWPKIASLLPSKTAAQCRERFQQIMVPHSEWSERDDEELIDLQSKYHDNWRTIATVLRKDASQCRDRYTQLMSSHTAPPGNDPRPVGSFDSDSLIVEAEGEVGEIDQARLESDANLGRKARRKRRERGESARKTAQQLDEYIRGERDELPGAKSSHVHVVGSQTAGGALQSPGKRTSVRETPKQSPKKPRIEQAHVPQATHEAYRRLPKGTLLAKFELLHNHNVVPQIKKPALSLKELLEQARNTVKQSDPEVITVSDDDDVQFTEIVEKESHEGGLGHTLASLIPPTNPKMTGANKTPVPKEAKEVKLKQLETKDAEEFGSKFPPARTNDVPPPPPESNHSEDRLKRVLDVFMPHRRKGGRDVTESDTLDATSHGAPGGVPAERYLNARTSVVPPAKEPLPQPATSTAPKATNKELLLSRIRANKAAIDAKKLEKSAELVPATGPTAMPAVPVPAGRSPSHEYPVLEIDSSPPQQDELDPEHIDLPDSPPSMPAAPPAAKAVHAHGPTPRPTSGVPAPLAPPAAPPAAAAPSEPQSVPLSAPQDPVELKRKSDKPHSKRKKKQSRGFDLSFEEFEKLVTNQN